MYSRCSSFSITLVPFLLAGCIGPGPVSVVTEDVRITTVPQETIFGKSVGASSQKMVEVVQFELSSDTDFHRHFKHRLMQIRCTVEGNSEHAWSDFGFGPFYEGIDLSSSSAHENELVLAPRVYDGRYAYTVYAFADLSATRLEDGHLLRRTRLEPLHFSRLSCFIVGVAMAPVSFPRSNEFTLNRDEFIALLPQRSAVAPPNKPIEADVSERTKRGSGLSLSHL